MKNLVLVIIVIIGIIFVCFLGATMFCFNWQQHSKDIQAVNINTPNTLIMHDNGAVYTLKYSEVNNLT